MKLRNRQTVCRRKRRYGARHNAERARRATGTERSARGLVVYECEFCHGYHVGHRSHADRQRQAQEKVDWGS